MKLDHCAWNNTTSTDSLVKLLRPRHTRVDLVRKQAQWIERHFNNKTSHTLPLSDENTALDRLIDESRTIVAPTNDETDSDHPSFSTWDRATKYLRRLSLHADIKGYDLPLPRILPAQDGSVDLLWKSGSRGLLINFPAGEEKATYYGKKPNLQASGVLFTDSAHEELIRWLVF